MLCSCVFTKTKVLSRGVAGGGIMGAVMPLKWSKYSVMFIRLAKYQPRIEGKEEGYHPPETKSSPCHRVLVPIYRADSQTYSLKLLRSISGSFLHGSVEYIYVVAQVLTLSKPVNLISG